MPGSKTPIFSPHESRPGPPPWSSRDRLLLPRHLYSFVTPSSRNASAERVAGSRLSCYDSGDVTPPLAKVLIANRGEIAVRIIRTCREVGLGSVAVFSEADRESLHVLLADEAVPLGPSTPAESYLNIDKLVAAARATGADAIHPGYGFLAENAAFAEACAAAGLVFIGPPPAAIRSMGDKVAARRVARELGVPVIPGTERPLSDEDEALRVAAQVGYPLMIKAALGGGGKGMRLVRGPDELAAALRGARSEAETAFGNAAVYLERYLEEPRHIEIQILADGHGNVVHLGERECSIQRRHQKLIEESPSPFVDRELRHRIGDAACRIASAAGYVNAGTVEFLVDRGRQFYFLEMNTRLQVEHPVTELVTGRDLVKEQFRIAAGEKLGFTQDDVVWNGWAIECRINAEDPYAGFVPSPGRITNLRSANGPWVRDDSGVYSGYTIPRFYDTLMAKLIVWAPDRGGAIARMARALAEYEVVGVRTTIPLLQHIIRGREFAAGQLSTQFLERVLREHRGEASSRRRTVALIAATLAAYDRAGKESLVNTRPGSSAWRLGSRPGWGSR
ncbi:MAG: acetyl-CoA carboxylase biotin carboxylase subunit [Candidatus Rokuibacteriota bacterium]|nr:MAG: acetyl-CoA carboxylase biotin carboxylase subunit [Candidatus Rokubacteria bacterium]